MAARRAASFGYRRAGSAGFSLIEVLIALLVLSVGLLGLALLQVLNVRYTASAQSRTVATNLATEVLDMMRSNPRHVVLYNRITTQYFDGYAPPAGGCTSTGDTAASALNNIARWRCDVASRLPSGRGSVVVAGNEATGFQATVTVTWTDDVGRSIDVEDASNKGLPAKTTSFQVVSTL